MTKLYRACLVTALLSVTSLASGPTPEALEALDRYVARLVERDVVVGAELHVLHQRKSVLHTAHGWADRDRKQPLKPNAIYCVRSMTKPLTGTIVQMLLDEGRLRLDQRVAEFVPAFDRDGKRNITIEHLLAHRSGLPFTTIARPLSEYTSLTDVANEAALRDLQFSPGSNFQYSDAGSDTLGAIVEKVTGKTLGAVVTERLLKPLKMEDSITLLERAPDAQRKRIPSAYSGGTGGWSRHWDPQNDPALFPVFLGSQSLYATTTDYARFLNLWMDRGRLGDQQVLTSDALRRGLARGSDMGYRTGLSDLSATYQHQWIVYHNAKDDEPVVFGHNGSDGTYAWAWPKRDLVVLFFTQSRGSDAGLDLESVIDQLLIRGDVEGFRKTAELQQAANNLAQYEGLYWDEDVETAYYLIQLEEQVLMIERPGRFRAAMKPGEQPGHFTVGRQMKIAFEMEDGAPVAFKMTTGTRTERQLRHEPMRDADALLAKLLDGRKLPLDGKGNVRLTGSIAIKNRNMSGPLEQLFDDRRLCTKMEMAGSETIVVSDGETVRMRSMGRVQELEGLAKAQVLLGHPSVTFGDWRKHYKHVEVLRRVTINDTPCLLIRTDNSMKVVAETTQQLVAEKWLEMIPGMGQIGVTTNYDNYQDVGPLSLPFTRASKYANALIGEIVVKIEAGEIGVADDAAYRLDED